MAGVQAAGHTIHVDQVLDVERGGFYGIERLIVTLRDGKVIRIVHNPPAVDINVIEAQILSGM